MKSLPERIMEHAEAMPEATPICPAALLHLGQRAAVGQALSRLARSGRLMRICQGAGAAGRAGRDLAAAGRTAQRASDALGPRLQDARRDVARALAVMRHVDRERGRERP